ncbi:MAG: methyltransferase domain-containing protein [Myxococcales bacterium]|nr:methyltransferase domain-containing protein [Myxococcales bacterium]
MRRFLLGVLMTTGCHRDGHAPDDTAPPLGGPPHGHEHSHRMHAMNHRFEDAEQWAKRFDDPSRDAWQKPDAVIAAMRLAPGDVVADVGAGTGYFAMRLAKAVPDGKVLASDVEPDMVRYLEERAKREGVANVVAVLGRADDPALPEPADVVLLCDVAHHVQGRVAFFERVRSQLRPGGRIVIVDFEPDAPDDAPGPPREHRLSAAALTAELVQAGFEAASEDHDLLPFQYVLQVRARS